MAKDPPLSANKTKVLAAGCPLTGQRRHSRQKCPGLGSIGGGFPRLPVTTSLLVPVLAVLLKLLLEIGASSVRLPPSGD